MARVVVPKNATQSSRQRGAPVRLCRAIEQEQELRSAVEQFVEDLESDSGEESEAAVTALQAKLSDATEKVRPDS